MPNISGRTVRARERRLPPLQSGARSKIIAPNGF
jgi:hypothetical protein